jgi:hypothetical protein
VVGPNAADLLKVNGLRILGINREPAIAKHEAFVRILHASNRRSPRLRNGPQLRRNGPRKPFDGLRTGITGPERTLSYRILGAVTALGSVKKFSIDALAEEPTFIAVFIHF